MEPNERQRMDLAGRIRAVRLEKYEGNRRAAYDAARVNSATWDSAENGRRMAERSLVKIVKTLWPETGGDWQQLNPPLGADDAVDDREDQIRRSNLAPETKDYILRKLLDERESEKRRGETA